MHDTRRLARVVQALWRGWCLRCPRCGARTLFRTWLSMHERCAVCGWRFEREQGYFVGAMYINYGFTVALVMFGALLLGLFTSVTLTQQLVLWGTISLIFPFVLFRHARGVWLSFDYVINPASDDRSEDYEHIRDEE